MQVYIAKNNGFCKGVEKAVKTALSIASENVYILGDLIHNEKVVKEIEERGAKTCYSIDEIPNGAKVIIRSHGAPRSVYCELNAKGCEIVDCTCAFVKRTQNIIYEKSGEGYGVLIVGESTHPEVIGLKGWALSEVVVTDGESLDYGQIISEKICIVAQTTFSYQNLLIF